jgi:sulfopropanediol 3-dehydrogenase
VSHKTLKSPTPTDASRGGPTEVEQTVADVIDAIRTRGDAAAREYSLRFDNWAPESFLLDEADVKNVITQVRDQVLSDIEDVQANVRRFAEAQLASLSPIEVQTAPSGHARSATRAGRGGGSLCAGDAIRSPHRRTSRS